MSDITPAGRLSTFRLRRRTPGSFLLVPCPKQGRSIRCQGQLEGAAATILVACPRVAHIQEQPLRIWYAWHGKDDCAEIQILDGPPAWPSKRQKNAGTSYIVPDFLVEMVNGQKRLVEVKASCRLARSIVQRKLAVGRAFAAQEGWTFHLLTEKELFDGPLLGNVRLLNRYRQCYVDKNLLEQIVLHVSSGGIEFGRLLDNLESNVSAEQSQLRLHILHLLATNRLCFHPHQQPLGDFAPIFPGGTFAWDPFESAWAPSGSATDAPIGSSASCHRIASSPKM